MRSHRFVSACLFVANLSACAHTQVATVLPKGEGTYDIIGQSATEQSAYARAEEEAKYTCGEQERSLVVLDQASVYQGADKDKQGDVEAENVALAFFTGSTGKERNADDYKVTLHIACR